MIAKTMSNMDIYRNGEAFVSRATVTITEDQRMVVQRSSRRGDLGGVDLEVTDVQTTGQIGDAVTYAGATPDGPVTLQVLPSRSRGCGCGK